MVFAVLAHVLGNPLGNRHGYLAFLACWFLDLAILHAPRRFGAKQSLTTTLLLALTNHGVVALFSGCVEKFAIITGMTNRSPVRTEHLVAFALVNRNLDFLIGTDQSRLLVYPLMATAAIATVHSGESCTVGSTDQNGKR